MFDVISSTRFQGYVIEQRSDGVFKVIKGDRVIYTAKGLGNWEAIQAIKWDQALGKIAEAMEVWLPIRDLIGEMAEQIQSDRDSLVESFCDPTPLGHPYDIDTAEESTGERESLDVMMALLEDADEILGTAFSRPTINDYWPRDLHEDLSPDETA